MHASTMAGHIRNLKRDGQKVVQLVRWSDCQGGHIPRFHCTLKKVGHKAHMRFRILEVFFALGIKQF